MDAEIGTTSVNQALRQVHGFTLVELLVTLAILAILTSLVTLSPQWVLHSANSLHQQSIHITGLINMAREEAMLTGRTMGMSVTRQNISFHDQDIRHNRWQPSVAPLLKEGHDLPPDYSFTLHRVSEHSNQGAHEGPSTTVQYPNIVFFHSGEMTPFDLTLNMNHENAAIRIHYDSMGRHERLEELPHARQK